MSGRFLKLAVAFLIIGMAFGLQMAIGHTRAMTSVHAHIALMGWVSMAVFGVVYRLWPRLETGALAALHFWLYAAGFVVSMTGLVLLETSKGATGEPLAAAGSMAAAAGALCFAARVLRSDLSGG